MFTRRLYIKKYDWRVKIFYSVTCYWTSSILRALRRIGCPEDYLRTSYENLSACMLDTGITYSNYQTRRTVMVIGKTSSPSEFMNSFDHERKHLEAHIAQAYNMDPWGEEIAYMSGEIARDLTEDVQRFICDCGCQY